MDTVLLSFFGGLLMSMLLTWRTWRDLFLEIRYHGFDNHDCNRIGCCR